MNPELRLAILTLGVLGGLAATARGPAPQLPAAGGPRLAVDFGVVLADGTPVQDLAAGEVEIRLNGRARKVLALRRVTAAPPGALVSPAATADRLPPPYASNEDVVVGRSFVLLVDELSFVAGRESLLRNSVDGLLAHFGAGDRALVLALPYGGLKIGFTPDHDRIRKVMAETVGQGNRGESGSAMAERTRTFLETLEAFLQGQAGRRTPLTIVLFTAGLAAPRRDAPPALAPGRGELLIDQFRRIGERAGAARANFYLLQPDDIKVSTEVWKETIAGRDYLGSDNPLEGIEHLSGVTKAVRLPLDAKGAAALERVALETSAYYVADLEPERREVMGRSRPMDVRVSRDGATVRARPQITFPETRRRPEGALEDVLLSGDPATDLPLRAAAFVVRESPDHLRAGVVLEPAEPGVSLSGAAAVLVEPNGRIAARWTAKDVSRRPLLGAMAAPTGSYRLRVAAADAAGRTGVVDQFVDLRLVQVGPLSLGSLMLGVSRPEGVALQLEFGAEPSAIASFDIYGGQAGLPLAATLELIRPAEQKPLASLPVALSATGEGRVAATATVPIGALAPGDYEVRGVVQLQDGTSGSVSRTLRKVARPSDPLRFP